MSERAIRILIADDEAIIANGLAEHMPWASLGCRVAAVVYSGEALERAIREEAPDIVISDIVMPGRSGLDVAEALVAAYPALRVILISAWQDFDYAQRAVALGIRAYFVKPIDQEALFEQVRLLAEELRSEHRERDRVEQLEASMRRARPIISASLLFEIARSGPRARDHQDPHWRGELPAPRGVVLALSAARPDAPLYLAQRNFARSFERHGLSLIRGSADRVWPMISLYETEDGQAARRRILVAAHEAQRECEEQLGQAIRVAISPAFDDYEGLYRSYHEAIDRLALAAEDEDARVIDLLVATGPLSQGEALSLRRAIEAHFRRPDFSLQELADAVRVSPSHLSRLYKQRTGENFLELLTRRRVEEAQQLLSATTLPIAEVASRSGFEDPRYFSQVFRRLTGQSPSSWRSAQQRSEEAQD